MKKNLPLSLTLFCLAGCSTPKNISQKNNVCSNDKFRMVMHAGVGYNASAAQSDALKRILSEGHAKLKSGATAVDVVQYAVEQMENSGIFNAGKGGTRTSLKTVELDSSIMDGSNMMAGAVASVKDVKNPVRLARAVKDKTPHVFMVGEGASNFARSLGMEMVTPDYYAGKAPTPGEKAHYGTVGAVALDRCGNLASATSTGGLFGKLPGRVGDSPVIGAGTYANNKTCAISATGEGEKFIRATVGSRISAILQYTDRKLKSAMKESLDLVVELGGSGGIVGIDKFGDIQTDTSGGDPMPRGHVTEVGDVVVSD
jgi:beta-aspartyl-peptidase (threonine type)